MMDYRDKKWRNLTVEVNKNWRSISGIKEKGKMLYFEKRRS